MHNLFLYSYGIKATALLLASNWKIAPQFQEATHSSFSCGFPCIVTLSNPARRNSGESMLAGQESFITLYKHGAALLPFLLYSVCENQVTGFNTLKRTKQGRENQEVRFMRGHTWVHPLQQSKDTLTIFVFHKQFIKAKYQKHFINQINSKIT